MGDTTWERVARTHRQRRGGPAAVQALGNLIRPYRSIAWTVHVLPFFVLKDMSS